MSGFESNPFADSSVAATGSNPMGESEPDSFADASAAADYNPFEAAAVKPPPLASKPASGFGGGSGGGGSSKGESEGVRLKELELNKREAELAYRERKLTQREAALGSYQPPNWPKFRPIIYHDIKADIPSGTRQQTVYFAYSHWFLTVGVAALNCLAMFCVMVFELNVTRADPNAKVDIADHLAPWGFSLLYTILGATLFGFMFAYRTLYAAGKGGRPSLFVLWAMVQAVLLGFAVFFWIGIPSTGGAGLVRLIQMWKEINDTENVTPLQGPGSKLNFIRWLVFASTMGWTVYIVATLVLVWRVYAMWKDVGASFGDVRKDLIVGSAKAVGKATSTVAKASAAAAI